MPVSTTGAGSSTAGGSFPAAPANTVAPVVSELTYVGSTLTTTNGTWTDSPTSFTYQWFSAGVAIPGATNNTYVSQMSDLGNLIYCVVTAYNTTGHNSAQSNSVGPITNPPAFQPSLKYNNKRNSMYLGMLLGAP